MTLKTLIFGTVAAGAAFVLLRAARAAGADQEAKIIYVEQPNPAAGGSGKARALGIFDLVLGLADSVGGGRVINDPWGGDLVPVAAGGDRLPQVVKTSYAAPGNFAGYESRYNLPAGYLGRTAQIESGGDPKAQNPRSSAGGLFQFIDSTAREYGLLDRFDAEQATDAAARLASNNGKQLRKVLGRDPSAAELYLAHQQGGAGASRLLSNPSARASDLVGANAVRLNGGAADMTAGQFAGLWLQKFNKGF
jgi:hypothetical protein